MSANLLIKLNRKNALQGLFGFAAMLLIAGNVRVIVESQLRARQIDEKILTEANPRLNRSRIMEALELIENQDSDHLTSIFSTATVVGETAKRQVSVHIENASGVNGAAANLAQALTEGGFQVSAISTAPSLEDQTTVFHRSESEKEARTVRILIESQGWTVGRLVERSQTEDIRIVLGTRKSATGEGR